MTDWRAIVGGNVRRLRTEAKLTQEQLAFAAEIDLTYVGGIERGKRNPSVLVLARVAMALGKEPIDLLQRR
ncbi:helix-turn-helix transcriptional regulator [Sphingomonas bacterium]|uniref:helix-turn-helix domain-containing protein n=1 Tax=Sphingomonas bacterium TaxID=1895847 RepID=UPI002619F3ED|nr:helix-turn-helix transcriptional regulator [Sphingomonas bacterium]